MKSVSLGILAGSLFLGLASLSGQVTPAPATPPLGTLGLPLGTFAVIEGTEHASIETNGIRHDFRVEIVNGKKMDTPVEIETEARYSDEIMAAGKRYVLHGYESGIWHGSPPLPPDESNSIPSVGNKPDGRKFCFFATFHITSWEKENGVILPDSRPVDPAISLVEPKFGQPGVQPPIGVTGQPLGTYMVITVRAPRKRTPEIVFDLLTVNGKPVTHRTTIAVPFLEIPSDPEILTVHGFESGDWRGRPLSLPVKETEPRPSPIFSEISESGGFSFSPYFIVTNWTRRQPSNPPGH